MKPLYQVGEEVILQSKDCPELNGEAVVLQIMVENEIFPCIHCGEMHHTKGAGFVYQLDVATDPCCVAWIESALRKKPKPSDLSFDEIIKDINLQLTV